MNMTQSKFKVKDLTYMAMCAILIAICAWISIPTTIPFTLQTFAICAVLLLLGGKNGTLSIVLYILLGAIGVPVFAGFSGGFGVLLSTTGGYIIGFIAMGLIYWLLTSIFGEKIYIVILALVIGLFACYAFGTAWFIYVYSHAKGPVALKTALGWCVFPYIIPDLIKMGLGITLAKSVKKYANL